METAIEAFPERKTRERMIEEELSSAFFRKFLRS
jgi:hypothetical protein